MYICVDWYIATDVSKDNGWFNYRYERSFEFSVITHSPDNTVLYATRIESSLNRCEQLRFQNTVT